MENIAMAEPTKSSRLTGKHCSTLPSAICSWDDPTKQSFKSVAPSPASNKREDVNDRFSQVQAAMQKSAR